MTWRLQQHVVLQPVLRVGVDVTVCMFAICLHNCHEVVESVCSRKLAPTASSFFQQELPADCHLHYSPVHVPAGMDPGARHFLWGILQRQVIAAGGCLCTVRCSM